MDRRVKPGDDGRASPFRPSGRIAPPILPLCEPPPGRYHGIIMARAIRILGIDPGLRRTGWGVIEADGNRLIYVA